MKLCEIIEQLTPGPWQVVDPRHLGQCVRIEGTPDPETGEAPVVCELWDPNWQANGRLITAAPTLFVALQLALHLLQQPDLAAQSRLRRIALKRGLEVMARITGQTPLKPDPVVREVLRQAGIIEPSLTELALTTTPALAEGWVRYAQEQKLGTGFVVAQLRAGQRPPPVSPHKTWYSEAERHLIMT